MEVTKFNIRVYGILINEKNEILVADEIQSGKRFTKFPGGGLEFGEGTKDCLIREWEEELNQKIELAEHIYTTDYFQISAFNPAHQLISIYYKVKPTEPLTAGISTKPFDFNEEKEGAISFRWISISSITSADMTFPVDKLVIEILKGKSRS
jgi:8-oxo-dGTP diphosphatase